MYFSDFPVDPNFMFATRILFIVVGASRHIELSIFLKYLKQQMYRGNANAQARCAHTFNALQSTNT